MKSLKAFEITVASTIAALALVTGARAGQHYSRYEARLADQDYALQSAPAAERAPAASWYDRRTGHGPESSSTATTVPFARFRDHTARNCATSVSAQAQRPWCS